MLKKTLALLLALVMTVGMLAGCNVNETPNNDEPNNGDPSTGSYETPNFNGETLDVYLAANSDLDVEGCYADQIMSKTLNLNLVFHELDSFDAQYNPMLAEKDIPSLTLRNSWSAANVKLGEDGAMINVLEYIDKMPNVKAFLETEDGQLFVKNLSVEEGVLYAVPVVETGKAAVYGYIYREDVFKANNMTFPTTEEGFYNTLKQLKTLYPDSYPFVMRGGVNYTLAWTFGIGAEHPGFYNSVLTLQNGKYIYAPATQNYKEYTQYLKKLLDEKLLHPSTITIDSAGWQEALASNTSFITFDKMDRLPALNQAGTALNPDFKLVGAAGIPLGTNGRVETEALAKVDRYLMIGDNDQLETTLKYVDWLFSDEGKLISNWGIEGESYTVDANGEKHLDLDFVASKGTFKETGLAMYGLAAYIDFDAYLSSCDEDLAESIAVCLDAATADPQPRLTYSADDQTVFDTYGMSIWNYSQAQLAKFVMGERDFSEWDDFVNELYNDYHLADLQRIHENAYNAR